MRGELRGEWGCEGAAVEAMGVGGERGGGWELVRVIRSHRPLELRQQSIHGTLLRKQGQLEVWQLWIDVHKQHVGRRGGMAGVVGGFENWRDPPGERCELGRGVVTGGASGGGELS